MRVSVCDAGPIIHLYEAHCLPLLSRIGDIFLPYRVHLEVQTTIHMDKQWPEWLHIVRLTPNEQSEAEVWQTAGGKRHDKAHDGEGG